jgi:hypothetical protein
VTVETEQGAAADVGRNVGEEKRTFKITCLTKRCSRHRAASLVSRSSTSTQRPGAAELLCSALGDLPMSEGQSIKIGHRPLRCTHCGGGQFAHRTAQLNTSFMEFLDLSWLNKSADIYVCMQCGLLHWFLEPDVGQGQEPKTELNREEVSPEELPPEELPTEDDLTEPTECLECHKTIPAGSAKCPACGWSYQSS